MKRTYGCEKCKAKQEIEYPKDPVPSECTNRKPGEETCRGRMVEITPDSQRVYRIPASSRTVDQLQAIQKEDSDLMNAYIGATSQFFALQKVIRENLDRREFLQKKLKKTYADGMKVVIPRWERKDQNKEWGYDWANKEFIGIEKPKAKEEVKVQSSVNKA